MAEKRKQLPLNKIQGKGFPKFDIDNFPKKRRKEKKSTSTSTTTSTTTNTSSHVTDESVPSIEEPVLLPRKYNVEPNIDEEHLYFSSSIPIKDQLSIYKLELINSNFFQACSANYTSFAMADFDVSSQSILKKKIQVVIRNACRFKDGLHWLYRCTCDNHNMDYMQALSDKLDMLYSEFEEKGCMHINISKSFANETDEQLDVHPEVSDTEHNYGAKTDNSQDLCELKFGQNYVFLKHNNKPGVVSVINSKLHCLTCQNKYCEHCKIIQNFFKKTTDEEVPEIVLKLLLELNNKTENKTYEYRTTSTNKIPFNLKEEQRLSFLEEFDIPFINGKFIIKPNKTECPDCFSALKENYCGEIPVFFKYKISKADVYSKKCDCGSELMYDGGSSCFLNMNSFIIHHAVLRDYMLHFLHARCTLFSYFTIWHTQMKEMGFTDFLEVMNYTKFRHSWYSFLSLIDIDFNEGFTCSVCGPKPNIIVCDGTSLAFRKSFVTWSTHVPDCENSEIQPGRYMYKDRTIIPVKKIRNLIKKFLNTPLTNEEYNEMVSGVETNFPAAVFLLESDNNMCHINFQKMLEIISSSSPTCAFLPVSEELSSAIDSLIATNGNINEHPKILKTLQLKAPMLYNILKDIGTIPDNYKNIINKIYLISKKILLPSASKSQQFDTFSADPSAYFPGLATHRRRGVYSADKKKFNNGCKKDSTGHPSLLPGIFTVFCEHGICYGFQIMENNESPNIPFTFLKTRFETAPDVIIYDNACNLHAYCLNRDPEFFAKCRFVVDNMHWGNHKSCSKCYHAKVHADLQHINTQMVEQNNSKLKKLKSQLSYMNFQNFMSHLKLFLWNCNHEQTQKNYNKT